MKRTRLAAMVLAGLVAIGLVTMPVGAGASTARATAKPDRTAILRLGANLTQGGGPSFDPPLIGGASTSEAGYFYMPYIYDTFVRVEKNGDLTPGLATKWTVASNQMSVLVTIRSGVKFQDGTPFTVDAVKQAWDRIRTAVGTSREVTWDKVTAVDVVGNDQVKVTLSAPLAGAFVSNVMTEGAFSGVPSPTAYAKYGSDYRFHPVGPGPYAFDSLQPGQKVSLRKWGGYWDAKNSQLLGGLDIIQTGSGAPTVASFQADQIDLARVSAADTPGLKGQSNLQVTAFGGSASSLVLLPCTNKAPFNNANARAAVSMAINRKAVDQATYNSSGTPAETLFPKGSPFYTADLEGKHAFNVKKAKALATKGGIQPGTNVKLMVAGGSQGADRGAVVIQDNLAKIGINAEIFVSSAFTADQLRVVPELILVQLDASNVQYFLRTGQIPNWCKYSNPSMDSAIVTILGNGTDSPANKASWRAVQQTISTESPYIVITHAPILWGHTNQVKNLEITPKGRLIVLDVIKTKS